MILYFIIPIYNTEKYLRRCVDSVIRQTFPYVRMVLVDDGSTDNSSAICDEYKKKYRNVDVIHKKNGGLSDARNCGLDFLETIASPDDYVTFLDSDDFVRETFADHTLTLCMESDSDALQCEYEKGSESAFPFMSDHDVYFAKNAEAMLLDQRLKSMSCAKIYRLSCFKDVRFPVGVWNEDEFTTYRALYNCGKIAITSEKLYYYYQHTGSIMNCVAKNMKNNPHLYDWLDAYKKRIEFFKKENKPEQVVRTHEKICTDAILRYCEQAYLKKEDRDEAFTSGEYIRLYKKSFPIMINRKNIAPRRRLMYYAFYIFPFSAVLAGKIFGLRK